MDLLVSRIKALDACQAHQCSALLRLLPLAPLTRLSHVVALLPPVLRRPQAE